MQSDAAAQPVADARALFAADRFAVLQGPNWLGRGMAKLVLRKSVPAVFPVLDADGGKIASIEKVDTKGAGMAAWRLLRFVVGNNSHTGYAYRVSDPAGQTLMTLHVKGRRVEIEGSDGRPVGSLENVSRINGREVEVRFDRAEPDKPFVSIELRGQPLATFAAPNHDEVVAGEILDASSRPVARVSNEGSVGRYLVVRTAPLDEELSTFVVAFACSLVDRSFYMRSWLWVPRDDSPH